MWGKDKKNKRFKVQLRVPYSRDKTGKRKIKVGSEEDRRKEKNHGEEGKIQLGRGI